MILTNYPMKLYNQILYRNHIDDFFYFSEEIIYVNLRIHHFFQNSTQYEIFSVLEKNFRNYLENFDFLKKS